MTHILMTFLGRVEKGGNYNETDYCFSSGAAVKTRYFGLTLREKLQAEKLVILGTSGSMWEVLFIEGVDLTEEAPSAVEQLSNAAKENGVTQELLNPLQAPLSSRLGCEVRLLRIPYAPTEAEQLKLLGIMAAEVNTGDRVSLDITHGFRHLPMLALLSALHLREAKNATIEGIWYGAYDSDTKKAPVYNLAGLLRMADWIGALRTFDKDGDYGAFADRLDQDGLASVDTNHLRRAAFFERTSNPRDARKELANFDKVLARGLPGVGALFADQLRHRLKWHRSGDTFTNQADLATFYRKRGDYIRAAIFAYEAFVTRLIDREAGEREDNYKHREAAFKAYEKGERGNQRLKSDYWLLKNLRNTLAHGNEPDDKDDKRDRRLPGITTDEERLNRELERLIQTLLRASG